MKAFKYIFCLAYCLLSLATWGQEWHNLMHKTFLNTNDTIMIDSLTLVPQSLIIKDKEGKVEFLIIASFNKPDQALLQYKERWQIETCFKAIKSSGFDIEKTHLQEIQRIEKLVLLVMIAFVWCYKVGIYLHQNIKPIEIKSHGRKATKSIFKYGLNYIACTLLNVNFQGNINIFNFLSCT